MTNPATPDSEPASVTDLADFKARLRAATTDQATPDQVRALLGEPGAPIREFLDAPLKALPLLTPPDAPVQLRLRVELLESHPPIWRQLTLPSDMELDVVHEVMQTAFGWTDSHLHRFALPDDPYAHQTQGILTPFDVAEGDDGVLESELRLDQLLAREGDSLLYTYDFGDEWNHLITVDAVAPLLAEDSMVRCIDGRRSGAAEDVGGVRGWEQLLAVAAGTIDPDYPEQLEVALDMGLRGFVDEVDLAGINRGLDRLAGSGEALDWLHGLAAGSPSNPLATLVAAVGPEAQLHLAGYLAAARAEVFAPIDLAEAEAATWAIRTFLDQVGDGIRLTSAGFLPPARVRALMQELDTDKIWRDGANRESQTYPLLVLREAVTRMGLVRKLRGDLLLTKRGEHLRTAPIELWQHVAERLPLERDECGRDCAVLLLMLVAADEAGSWERVRESLDLLSSMVGWSFGGRGRYGNDAALSTAAETRSVLGWVGTGSLLPGGTVARGLASTPARRLAQAALASWG